MSTPISVRVKLRLLSIHRLQYTTLDAKFISEKDIEILHYILHIEDKKTRTLKMDKFANSLEKYFNASHVKILSIEEEFSNNIVGNCIKKIRDLLK